MTFAEESKMNRLSISLRDIGIDENTEYGFDERKTYNEIFTRLVVFSPTTQSHLGEKFDCYSKLNNRSLNKFLKSLFSKLGIKEVYLFTSFSEKTKRKKDLKELVLNNQGSMLCLRCDNGVRDSLYMAIRNSVAHGNILEKNDYVVLYSVSDDRKEYDSMVTFFMRIKHISNLQALIKTLEAYR